MKTGSALLERLDQDKRANGSRQWRITDPPETTVGELGPDDLHHRVVVRTRDFLGTVYGTLMGVRAHPQLSHFTCIQLQGKKELTIRDDTEALVLDF